MFTNLFMFNEHFFSYTFLVVLTSDFSPQLELFPYSEQD